MTTPANNSDGADAGWLMGTEAAGWLAELSNSSEDVHRLTSRLRKQLSAERVHLLVEQSELRRRATKKFKRAAEMFFTRLGYEQATDEWVARYKARRFAGLTEVADLCCGIGGDTAAIAAAGARTVACDRSDVALRFAEHNVRALAGETIANRVEWKLGDVMELDLESRSAWHIDPDRRPGGRRTTRTELHEPTDAQIDLLLERNPHGAIKLAPGCTPSDEWSDRGELEWISRDGQCRQLVVWFGSLATEPGMRRATLVDESDDGPVWSVEGEPQLPSFDASVERYLYEPDSAVLAADLAGWLAEDQGLWAFASTSGYLTGPALVDHPALQAFEVAEVMPYKPKQLAAYFRQRHIGRLEIKQRSVDVVPETLRKKLKLAGDNTATLVVTRVDEKRIAIVCHRLPPSHSTTGR